MRVKLADLTDNSDPARLALLPEDRARPLARRYERAKATLEAALKAHGPADDATISQPSARCRSL